MSDTVDTLLDRAQHWESTAGDRVYMTQPMGGDEVRTYTWKETLDEARRMATYLASFDFPPGSSIAILSKNCAHFIMSDLAIWMAGHVSVALYPTLNADTVRYILDHSEAKLLFVGKLDTWNEMKPGVPDDLPKVSYPLSPPNDYPTWDTLVQENERLEGEVERDPDDTAMLVYTSGSTGEPKGVVHSFRTISVPSREFAKMFDMTTDERQISYLPLAHVFERCAVEGCSLVGGGQVFFAESLDTFVQDLQRAQPTVFHSVPRLWLKFQLGVFKKMPPKKLERFMKIPILSGIVKKKVLKGLGLDQARLAFSGSAPIPPGLIDWYRDLGLELLEAYGMSENFAYSHMSLPGKTRAGYVGNACPGVDVRISDEGEIQVKSPANMLGYHKRDDLTAESFTEDGYLKTGDRGEIDSEGRLRITGRVKELFKTSKGKYVAPAPVENLINADNHVEQSCVTGSGQPSPFAIVMLSEDVRDRVGNESVRSEVDAALRELLERVNQKLEHHERLQFLVVVDDEWQIENGFLTPTMKIKRNILEDVYGPKIESWYAAGQPVVWASTTQAANAA